MAKRDTSPAQVQITGHRWTAQDAMVLVGLGILLAMAFWEVVIQGRVFFFRDFAQFFYPKRFYAAEAIRHFQIPFWEAYGGLGEPVLGAYQSAIFYPPAIIYYLLPMPTSFMWFVVFHFFVSGAGAYYMMRAWGTRRAAAAFTAFAWAFSPAFISTVDNVSFQTSLAWLPWCVAFARRIYDGRGFSGFLWLSITFAMSVLAGAPEPVIFVAVVLAALVLWRGVSLLRRRGIRAAVMPALAVCGAVVTGFALSGVELVPFLYALGYSPRRSAFGAEEAGLWSAKPKDVILWFLPRFYLAADRGGIHWGGQYWLKTVYMGALIPFLALWTALAVRRGRNWFFAVLAVGFISLALGSHSVIWRFLYDHAPGVALIRYPVKFFLPAAFAMAVLAGFAVDDLQVLARRGAWRRIKLLLGVLLAVAVLFGACAIAMHVWDEDIFKAITPRLYYASESGIETAQQMFESLQWSFDRSALFLFLGAGALLATALIVSRRIPRPYGGLALVMVLFADIGIFGAHLNPVAGPQTYTDAPKHLDAVPHGLINSRTHQSSAVVKRISLTRLHKIQDLEGLVNYLAVVKGVSFRSQEELFNWLDRTSAPRFRDLKEADDWLKNVNSQQFTTDVEYELCKEALIPNINLLYDVALTDTFEPMLVKWHNTLLARLRTDTLTPERLQFLPYLWGASVIEEKTEYPPEFQYTPATRPGSRAVIADHYISVATDREAFATVALTTVDVVRRPVLFAPDAAVAAKLLGPQGAAVPERGSSAPGSARVTADNGNRVTVETDAPKPSILFLADCWYPLFRAKVDGAPAPLWRANYAYRAVPVPAGRHMVEFTYLPLDFYAGLAVTLVGIMALVVAAVIYRRRQRRRAMGGASMEAGQ